MHLMESMYQLLKSFLRGPGIDYRIEMIPAEEEMPIFVYYTEIDLIFQMIDIK
tara:strand:- start:322 stop:480 length:159 start_codon:yes stop_codon:yes gene_type:complete